MDSLCEEIRSNKLQKLDSRASSKKLILRNDYLQKENFFNKNFYKEL